MSGSDDNQNDQDDNENEGGEEEEQNNDDGGSDDGEKRFTQKELDQHIKDRLARAGKGMPTKAELAELREKAKKHDELAAASQTAEERAKADKEAADAKAVAATARARSKSLKAAIASACAKQGVADLEVITALISTGEPIEYDEDDEPEGIDERVKAILKSRPALKGSKFETDGDGGVKNKGKPNYSDPEYLASLPMEEYMRLRGEGKIPK